LEALLSGIDFSRARFGDQRGLPRPGCGARRRRRDDRGGGGDYRIADLPEATLLESWGGQAVVLPYVPGRSTTRLIAEVARRG